MSAGHLGRFGWLILGFACSVYTIIVDCFGVEARELTFRDAASLVSGYLDKSLEMSGVKKPRLLVALPGDNIPAGCVSRNGITEIYGSHYCPASQTVVLEVYELETLRRKFGDGSIAYAVAHEYAHYLQDVLGVEYSEPYNELHADCWAGSLLLSSAEAISALGITERDVVEMLLAAYSVGGGSVHGTSRQRVAAFQRGIGGMFACDNEYMFALRPSTNKNIPPIPEQAMNDMTLAAAVNVCELAVESKVPVQSGVLSTAKAITYVVTSRYGSQIGNTTKLQPEQIANGAIIQTVARVKQGCYAKLNAADKKFVDDVMADFQKQVNAQKKK